MQMVIPALEASSFLGEEAEGEHQVQKNCQVMEVEEVDQSQVEVVVLLEATCQEELVGLQSQVMM